MRFVTDQPDRAQLSELDGVTAVDVCGTGVSIDSLDADATVRDLVGRGVLFRDLEITGAGLEQAFMALDRVRRRCSGAEVGPATETPTSRWVERTGDRPFDRSARRADPRSGRSPVGLMPRDGWHNA